MKSKQKRGAMRLYASTLVIVIRQGKLKFKKFEGKNK